MERSVPLILKVNLLFKHALTRGILRATISDASLKLGGAMVMMTAWTTLTRLDKIVPHQLALTPTSVVLLGDVYQIPSNVTPIMTAGIFQVGIIFSDRNIGF